MTQVFLAITDRSTGAIEAFNLSNVSRIKQGPSGNALVQYLIGNQGSIVFETKESFDEVMTALNSGAVVLTTETIEEDFEQRRNGEKK